MGDLKVRAVRSGQPWTRRLGSFVVQAARVVPDLAVSLQNWVFRRQRVPTGAASFRYDAPVRRLMLTLTIVAAVEVAVVDLIVNSWLFIRIPMLILGGWALCWMLGTWLGFRTRPHAVGPAGIRVRNSVWIDLDLPWDALASVERIRTVVVSSPIFGLSGTGESQVLHVPIQNETHIAIELEDPVEFKLPPGRVRVREIRIAVDDSRGFLDEVRKYL